MWTNKSGYDVMEQTPDAIYVNCNELDSQRSMVTLWSFVFTECILIGLWYRTAGSCFCRLWLLFTFGFICENKRQYCGCIIKEICRPRLQMRMVWQILERLPISDLLFTLFGFKLICIISKMFLLQVLCSNPKIEVLL